MTALIQLLRPWFVEPDPPAGALTLSLREDEAALCLELDCRALFLLRRGSCPRCGGVTFAAVTQFTMRRVVPVLYDPNCPACGRNPCAKTLTNCRG